MGCASSNFSYDCNESVYEASLQDRSKPCKRNFSKRIGSSDNSAFVESEESCCASKFWSSTSNWSRCSTPPPPPPRPTESKATMKKTKAKRSVFAKLSRQQMPKALAKLTLSDKTKDDKAQQQQQQQQQQTRNLEQSNGYFSASTDNFESSESTFDKNSMLLCTQDMDTTTSERSFDMSTSHASDMLPAEPVSNIKMEILMLRNNRQMMPKTSSPYCARRDTFACSGSASYTGTYRRWIECLEDMPALTFKDITAIPEAISGQFSPATHPAYTNVWNSECVSASKRYRYDRPRVYDEHAIANVPLALVVSGNRMPRTVVSTEM